MTNGNSATLGERLKKRREELGFSLEDLTEETQAPLFYLNALEKGTYGFFPAKVYGLGFLKKVLVSLDFDDKEWALAEFNREWNFESARRQVPVLLPSGGAYFRLTPKIAAYAAAAVFFAAFFVFLALRLIGFVSPPFLEISEPAGNGVLSENFSRVRGRVEKEGRLTVNGREFTIDEKGNFDEIVELSSGLNALEFWARDRFGRERKETRYLLVK